MSNIIKEEKIKQVIKIKKESNLLENDREYKTELTYNEPSQEAVTDFAKKIIDIYCYLTK